MKTKKKYSPAVFKVYEIVMEESIAAGSTATVLPPDAFGEIKESWEDDGVENRDFSW